MTRLKKASTVKNFIDVNMFNHVDFLSKGELDTKILKHPIEVNCVCPCAVIVYARTVWIKMDSFGCSVMINLCKYTNTEQCYIPIF